MDLLRKDHSLLQQSVRGVIAYRPDSGVLVCDANGIIMEANLNAEGIFGFTTSELVGKTSDIIIVSSSGSLPSLLSDAGHENSAQPKRHQVLGRHKDGKMFPVVLHIWRAADQNNYYFLQVTAEQKPASTSPSIMMQSINDGEHLQQLLDALPVGIFECNNLGQIKYCNQRFCSIFGYPKQSLTGMTFWSLAANAVELTKLHHYCRDIANKAIPEVNIQFRTHQQQTITVSLDLNYLRDKTHTIIGISGTATPAPAKDTRNLSARSKEELRQLVRERALTVEQTTYILEEQIKEHSRTADQLRRTNQILESVFTHTPIHIAYLDRHLVFVTANRAFIESFSPDTRPLTGRSIAEIPALRDRIVLLREMIENGGNRSFYHETFAHNPRRNKPAFFDWSVTALGSTDKNLSGLLLAFDDVTDYVNSQAEKQRTQEHLTSIVNNVPIILFAIAADGTVELAEGRGLTNIRIKSGQLIGRNITSCFPNHQTLLDNMQRALTGEEFSAIETIGQRVFEFCYKPGIVGTDGRCDITGIATDITDLKHTEQQLRNSRTLLAEAQKIAHLGNWTCEWRDGESLAPQYWSDEVYHIIGLDKQRHTPNNADYRDLVHEDDRPLLATAVKIAHANRQPYLVEYRLIRPDGQERILQERGIIKFDANGVAINMHGTLQDITERRRTEQFLLKVTNFDTLTGLPNRNLFQQHLQQAIGRAQRSNQMVALLSLDLDNFKSINESLGHVFGDQLLREVSQRLQAALRPDDTLARLSGDEFCVIMEQLQGGNDAAWMVQHIRKILKNAYTLGNHEVFCSACIGISIFPADAGNTADILQHSQSALRRAREHGRDSYQYYTTDMNTRALEHLLYENALRYALERNELELHYQPQVALNNGQVAGLEALLRWRHPDMGLIAPNQFIPLAEKTGLIVPIGLWVIRTACNQVRQWIAQGIGPLRMSVNMSPQQVFQPGIAHDIEGILGEVGLSPEFLKLELTESSLLEDSTRTRLVLNRLQQIGIKISIDDFGTGYSSLTYLKRIPLDTLKIDRSFIQDLPRNSDDAAISGAIIALAKSLNIRVIAEGVENVEQLRFLEQQDCDEAQGNFISEPLPAATMLQWLQQRDPTRMFPDQRITG